MSNDPPMTLRDVARAALDAHKGVSGRQLDRLAKKQGLTISYTTINSLAAGTYKSRPNRKTLEALAALAGLEIEDVYRAAELPMPRAPLRDDLPPDADLLDGGQRRIIVDLIRTFAQLNREIDALSGAEREDVMGNAEHPAAIVAPDESPAAEERMLHAARQTGRKTAAERAEELGRQMGSGEGGKGGTDSTRPHLEDGA